MALSRSRSRSVTKKSPKKSTRKTRAKKSASKRSVTKKRIPVKKSASKRPKIILLCGPSRVGKDSFINTLSQKSIANPGSETNFLSTTKNSELFTTTVDNTVWHIINIPGYDDNRNQFSA